MLCPTCRHENRSTARFCARCGHALAATFSETQTEMIPAIASRCVACGTALKRRSRFCPRCGVPVDERTPPPTRSVPSQSWALPPVSAATPSLQEKDQGLLASQPGADEHPTGHHGAGKRSSWRLGLLTALVSMLCVSCAIVGVAVGPAFADTVASLPGADPSRPDVTVYIGEAYVGAMIDESLPGGLQAETSLDVRPNNVLVLTTRLDLMFVRPEIIIGSRLSVVEGRIQIEVESVEAGELDIFGLIGVDAWTLGDELVDMLQRGLEQELGPGSELLDITTDEHWIILKARLN